MSKTADLVTRRLFESRYGKVPEGLTQFYGEKHAENITHSAPADQELETLIFPMRKIESTLHQSWLSIVIPSLPASLHPLAVMAFGEEIGTRLASRLKVKNPQQPTALGQRYLRRLLYQRFLSAHPQTKAPSGPLVGLTQLSSTQLRALISLLGVADLTNYMRTIVDKRRLQMIYQWLSEDETRYLHYCVAQNEKLKLPPIDLTHWSGDRQTLREAITLRG
ncbi:MAG: hypothetical protein KDK40_05385, partial [Chlamydiia bacterium]|nr:hypothetical protein [Chlamydiia bacterium]